MDNNEYRIKVTVRNNLLLSAIEDAGYPTQAAFAKACGVRQTEVGEYISLKKSPINKKGDFKNSAKKIMETLGACPSDLWSDEQLYMELQKNSSEQSISGTDIAEFMGSIAGYREIQNPEDSYLVKELFEKVKDKINSLTENEKKVLELRFGEDKTLPEIGDEIGLSRGRVFQIEQHALRRLRCFTYHKKLPNLNDWFDS